MYVYLEKAKYTVMREYEVLMNPNPLVKYLRKPAREFTRYDIIRFIEENGIEQVNFHYVGEDGKLKTLNFVVTSRHYLESIFATGERVDGSSLFTFIEAGTSDLYVIPRFRTAFVNPFSEVPTLDLLCSYYTKDGKPLESAPEHILRKAHERFKKKTGYKIKALGELEYYVIAPAEANEQFPNTDQKGYHASMPFAKFEQLRVEAMRLIAQCGGKIKYAHSEVGNFTTNHHYYEQHEIEFNPVDIEDAADQLLIAKWILRNLAYKYGVNISFAPKISQGKAGSGLHIHYMIADQHDDNLMVGPDGNLSVVALKSIAGLLMHAKSLTAFGNTIPLSYLRLVPNQEAPTRICWGETNRSALIRVPLGWTKKTQMIRDANPYETAEVPYIPGKQTVEFRVPDGSADVYHLLAAMVMAIEDGFEHKDALKVAKDLHVEVDIFKPENDHIKNRLESLPRSCEESADYLEADRTVYERDGVFPKGTIDRFINQLRAYKDRDLSERLYGKPQQIIELVQQYLHYM